MAKATPADMDAVRIGDVVRFREGPRSGSGEVLRIATGHGYPCFLVDWKAPTDPYPRWVGGESLLT